MFSWGLRQRPQPTDRSIGSQGSMKSRSGKSCRVGTYLGVYSAVSQPRVITAELDLEGMRFVATSFQV